MLAAYLDASGVTDRNGHAVLAGFVAPVTKWIEFETEWESLLKSPLYAKILEQRHGHLYAHGRKMRQWKADIREAFYANANYLLRNTVSLAVASVLKHSDYRSVYRNFPLTVKDSVYGLAFRAAMVAVCKHSNEKCGSQPVAFFLEGGDQGQGGALNIFAETKARARNEYPLESITVVPKERWGAVQVADMHAYSMQKHLDSDLRGNTGRGSTHPYFGDIGILLSDLDHVHAVVNRGLIQRQRQTLINNEQVKKAFGRAKYGARQIAKK